ncbi:MAG: hypothetical protein Q9227_003146 [Pyrenula ochraceoflavens]
METWKLTNPDDVHSPVTDQHQVPDSGEVMEVALENDDRKRVDREDYQIGSKFRSHMLIVIVKLFIGYDKRGQNVSKGDQIEAWNEDQPTDEAETWGEYSDDDMFENEDEFEDEDELDYEDYIDPKEGDSAWERVALDKHLQKPTSKSVKRTKREQVIEVQGTGYLIRKNLVVTAGHCVCGRYGHATYVKAFIGYHGRDSKTKDPLMTGDVEYNWGVGAAVPAEWADRRSILADVAFVQLAEDFVGVEPVPYAITPNDPPGKLWVVGYPGDRDNGNQMYVGTGGYFRKVSEEPIPGKVKHLVSTYAGKHELTFPCMSLHIFKPSFEAIATHTGGDSRFNVATIIGPNFQPPTSIYFGDYVSFFETSPSLSFTPERRNLSDGRVDDSDRTRRKIKSERRRRRKVKDKRKTASSRKDKNQYD